MKKYIFILFIALLVSSDSLWACAESLMSHQHQRVIKVDLSESELLELDKALLTFVKDGNYPLVKLVLAAGANVNHQDKNGQMALTFASDIGHIEIVKALIVAGANVNHQVNHPFVTLFLRGETALLRAVKHTEVVRLLLAAGADPNIQNNLGDTPLILASDAGYIETVKLLLVANADPNIQNFLGHTALMKASFRRHAEIVRLLLAAGADANLRSGWTALMAARGDVEIVRLLKKAGAKE